MLSFSRFTTITLFTFSQVYTTAAFVRLATSVLVSERADPVVSPGEASRHAHSISGGSNFGTTLTYDLLRSSDCTSSGVQQDMSAYWTPIVYFWHKNGSFIAPKIWNQEQQIYYKYNIAEDNEPFPEGFRMMAGQPLVRSYDPPPGVEEYTHYDCLDYATVRVLLVENPKTKDFPKQTCPYGVRMNVFFPRCGNGRLESDDRSHVVYRTEEKCPDSHPRLYPLLHYELYFSNLEDPANGIVWADAMNPSQPFVLSNGDPTGYGAHADFFNGWETSTLRQALKTCNGAMGANLADGRADTCPLFTIVDGRQCRKEGSSPDLENREQIAGWLPKLPGCNPITYTEEGARTQAEVDCGDGKSDPSVTPADPKEVTEIVPVAPGREAVVSGDRMAPPIPPPAAPRITDCSRDTVTLTATVTASTGRRRRRPIGTRYN